MPDALALCSPAGVVLSAGEVAERNGLVAGTDVREWVDDGDRAWAHVRTGGHACSRGVLTCSPIDDGHVMLAWRPLPYRTGVPVRLRLMGGAALIARDGTDLFARPRDRSHDLLLCAATRLGRPAAREDISRELWPTAGVDQRAANMRQLMRRFRSLTSTLGLDDASPPVQALSGGGLRVDRDVCSIDAAEIMDLAGMAGSLALQGMKVAAGRLARWALIDNGWGLGGVLSEDRDLVPGMGEVASRAAAAATFLTMLAARRAVLDQAAQGAASLRAARDDILAVIDTGMMLAPDFPQMTLLASVAMGAIDEPQEASRLAARYERLVGRAAGAADLQQARRVAEAMAARAQQSGAPGPGSSSLKSRGGSLVRCP